MSRVDGGRPSVDDGDWRVVEQRRYRRADDQGLTAVIVGAVAAVENVDVIDVRSPTLYDAVDTAAIEDGLFRSRAPAGGDAPVGAATFTYRDHRITVRSDGWVQVADRVRESKRGG